MPTSTCFVLAPDNSADSIRKTIVENVACFEMVITHSASQAQHALRQLEDVSFAVLDGHLPNSVEVVHYIQRSFPGVAVLVLADANVERFREATAVIPHNFPHALAVSLRREMAKRREHIRL